MNSPENNILDQKAFSYFQDLMGVNLQPVLLRHLEVASGYIDSMQAALKDRNLEIIASAAHPLGSSSRQIGAVQVAEIAENIERICNSGDANLSTLESLILQVKQNQSMVEEYIKSSIVGL